MAVGSKSKAARSYHEVVASLPCVLCDLIGQNQTAHTEVHHLREGSGLSQRAHHFRVAALCEDCHRGSAGIHGDRALLRIANVSEGNLADITAEKAWSVK
jgi:hypothetical protein